MARVYVGLGSNIEPARHIRAAVDALRQRFAPLQLSRVYESEAVGFEGANFYNMVVGFDTGLDVRAVAAGLGVIEQAQGRRRGEKRFAARTIDLDLLLYDDLILDAPGLRLPRAEILEYAFVLRPLAELAPQGRYPGTDRSFAALWGALEPAAQPLWPVELDFG